MEFRKIAEIVEITREGWCVRRGARIAPGGAGDFMALKYYIPVSVLFFVGVLTLVHHYSIPMLPFAVIMLAAETALGFRAGNHKVGDKVSEFTHALKSNPHGEPHQAH